MGAVFTQQTRTLFFDLEYQVPKDAQKSTYGSLLANPGRSGQKILGGSFCLLESTNVKGWTSNLKEIEMVNFWIWEYDNNEKKMLEDIFQYFKDSWSTLKGKKDREADLITCGIGISRFDLPILAYKFNAGLTSVPFDLIILQLNPIAESFFDKNFIIPLSSVLIVGNLISS